MRRWFFGRSHIYGRKNGNFAVHVLRWLIFCPWFGIRLQKILLSDPDPDFHDLPYSSLSLIFRGAYIEHVPGCLCNLQTMTAVDSWGPEHIVGPCRYQSAPTVLFRKSTQPRRLEVSKPVWMLVFMGPTNREWGFLTAKGWVSWKQYLGTT